MITAVRDPYQRAGRFEIRKLVAEGDRFEAWTDDSVLYPEGGGQPWDTGTLAGIAVTAVRKEVGHVVHTLAEPIPTPGAAEIVVDWDRRYDHMQQHTGQHLLSAIAQDEFGWPTTSFHLTPGIDALCDIEVGGSVADPHRLQARVNEEIRAARAVRAFTVDELPERVRSRGLPDHHDGPIRLVEIDGLDLNTCGGTHVRNTAELQVLAVLGTERVRGGTRLAFVVGQRVLARLANAERHGAQIGALLSTGLPGAADAVRRLLDEAKAASKARAAVADELADALGERLAAEARPVRVLHRSEGDLAFLNRIASAVLRGDPQATVWLTAEPDLFLLAAPPDRIDALRTEVLSRLGAKGGGPPGRLQGKGAALDRRDEIAALLP